MANCKKCNKFFHCCPSCGLWGYETEYCSKDCWLESEERQEIKNRLNLAIDSNNEKLLGFVIDLITGYGLLNEEAENILEEILKSRTDNSANWARERMERNNS